MNNLSNIVYDWVSESVDLEVAAKFPRLDMETDTQEDPVAMERTVNYIQQMGHVVVGFSVALPVYAIAHFGIVVPLNMATVYTIRKRRDLWTQVNAIVAINCFIQCLLSIQMVINLGCNLAHLLGQLETSEIEIVRFITWWMGVSSTWTNSTR